MLCIPNVLRIRISCQYHLTYSLNPLKGLSVGSHRGVLYKVDKGDIMNLDYSSYGPERAVSGSELLLFASV